ncbi:MAG: hypothetical protein WD850_02935 [Candidatus Spechtbacterales bacterium]
MRYTFFVSKRSVLSTSLLIMAALVLVGFSLAHVSYSDAKADAAKEALSKKPKKETPKDLLLQAYIDTKEIGTVFFGEYDASAVEPTENGNTLEQLAFIAEEVSGPGTPTGSGENPPVTFDKKPKKKDLIRELAADLALIKNMLSGDYTASGVSPDRYGNILEQLAFIRENASFGFLFGSNSANEVLTSANGTYEATNLTPDNVREGVAYGDGQIGELACYEYGSNDPSQVLTSAGGTFDATNLIPENVRAGIAYGVDQVGTLTSFLFGSNNPAEVLAIAGGSYDASNLIPENVKAGVTFGSGQIGTLTSFLFGSDDPAKVLVTAGGNALKDLFNGSGPSVGVLGGTQEHGGIDDYNAGTGVIQPDRYEGPWTKCTATNNYCETGLASADARDESTGLIWSLTCGGVGCATLADAGPLTAYNWVGTHANNGGKSASQLCSVGNHGESGWFLPHQKQFMQSYVDGSYGNVSYFGTVSTFWTATGTDSSFFAWAGSLRNGAMATDNIHTGSHPVRCVR